MLTMTATSSTAPPMALRTYRFLRFGVVGVILALAISLIIEAAETRCWQGSISAYYYTPARTMFVGTLLILGLVMIVLWGKTVVEDSFFNLAGLLAPVVAFVPTVETDDTRTCAFRGTLGDELPDQNATEKGLITAASRAAVENNMRTYLIVVLVVLLVFLFVHIKGAHTDSPVAFWVTWGTAALLFAFGAVAYVVDSEWLRTHAHNPSAYALFGCIGVAVIGVARDKWRGNNQLVPPEDPSRFWAVIYASIAGSMVLGLAAVFLLAWAFEKQLGDHKIFLLEAVEIALVAAFWIAQTIDRWGDGAPRPMPGATAEQTAGAIE
ncbi:hypothetical protein D0Z08_04855 [Nocardioides immobilis]|uniref:DUF998 domain-containing protein n=1 Tax=Nocardioides immobilis TaxID=2049295 RepID=A0A417Y6H9_9ACTN|nr:hypothetical protein [Nocardioides immobilis]RHW28308.1 hypothetical protein D0Z08_04855 [Nocardioides immobilis]